MYYLLSEENSFITGRIYQLVVVNKKSLGKLNILHVVGGKTTNGAFKGAYIYIKRS